MLDSITCSLLDEQSSWTVVNCLWHVLIKYILFVIKHVVEKLTKPHCTDIHANPIVRMVMTTTIKLIAFHSRLKNFLDLILEGFCGLFVNQNRRQFPVAHSLVYL
jgi:hypothetical protein